MVQTAVKEHPIIFSTQMIQAILGGSKTMTRRVVKLPKWPDPSPKPDEWELREGVNIWVTRLKGLNYEEYIKCPYGQVGDRLWIREAFNYIQGDGEPNDFGVCYKADSVINWWRDNAGMMNYPINEKSMPSIHMPRWASRIVLEIIEVRVGRVQDISEDDAKAEGTPPGYIAAYPTIFHKGQEGYSETPTDYRGGFARTWDYINAKRRNIAPKTHKPIIIAGDYSWASNPWVWVIGFRKLDNATV